MKCNSVMKIIFPSKLFAFQTLKKKNNNNNYTFSIFLKCLENKIIILVSNF